MRRTAVAALACLECDDLSGTVLARLMRLRSNDYYLGILTRAHGHVSRCLRQGEVDFGQRTRMWGHFCGTRAALALLASDDKMRLLSYHTLRSNSHDCRAFRRKKNGTLQDHGSCDSILTQLLARGHDFLLHNIEGLRGMGLTKSPPQRSRSCPALVC